MPEVDAQMTLHCLRLYSLGTQCTDKMTNCSMAFQVITFCRDRMSCLATKKSPNAFDVDAPMWGKVFASDQIYDNFR